MIDTSLLCRLCETPVRNHTYKGQEDLFCCAGCHAVYQILFSQKISIKFQDHPLFHQAVRSGIISNPELIEKVRLKEADPRSNEYLKIYLEIQDMWCPSCAHIIYFILMQEEGIRQCTVDYSTDLASIEYSPRYLSKEKIFLLIKGLGYRPSDLQDPRQVAISKSLYLRFIVAAFCSLNTMMFAYPIYASYFHSDPSTYAELFAWFSCLASIPVLTYSASPIWRRCYAAMQARILGMEALVLIGVSAAFILSMYELLQGTYYVYFDTMTIVILFVLLGKIIESKAKFSAKDALTRLTKGLPRRGRKRFEDGSESFVCIKELIARDHIVALTGEKIVLDGVVIEGEGACDESLMTGESLPLVKKAGDLVLAGSILQQGRLVIQVTAQADKTVLHHIIAMVEQDIGDKAKYIRSIDRIVKWFVPTVICVAFLTAAYCIITQTYDPGYTAMQTAWIRAISIILISCPCAIGIAAPLAEAYILNAFAKNGAIVRNRGCLAYLGKETIYVFDKTGTVTEGKFNVLNGLETLSEEDKQLLKGLVSCSNHPIAFAINQSLPYIPIKFQSVEEIIGKGLKGVHEGTSYLLGSFNFFKEQSIIFPATLPMTAPSNSINTTVFFAKGHVCIACLVLGDRIQPSIKNMLSEMHPIARWLVSGDSCSTVKYVAEQCGFDRWVGECLPLQKRECIEGLKKDGAIVAMIGDGINDAPALTAAHIGIAVVAASDISIQVSDILFTRDCLPILPTLRRIAIKGRRILKQNLFWAFFYNIIGIILAMNGLLSPIFAAFAMISSSMIVLLNAQRIPK